MTRKRQVYMCHKSESRRDTDIDSRNTPPPAATCHASQLYLDRPVSRDGAGQARTDQVKSSQEPHQAAGSSPALSTSYEKPPLKQIPRGIQHPHVHHKARGRGHPTSDTSTSPKHVCSEPDDSSDDLSDVITSVITSNPLLYLQETP